jgi:hypothetical protein
MRYSLLAGVAVVALSLGAPLAYAQDQSGTQERSGGAAGAGGGAGGSEMRGGASGGAGVSHAGSSSHLNGGANLNGGAGSAALGSGTGASGSSRNAASGSNREGSEQGMEKNGSRRHLGSGAARHEHMGSRGYDEEHRNRVSTGARENSTRSPDEMGSRENSGGVSSYSRESAGGREGGRATAHARLAPEQRDRFVSAIRRDHVATSEHVDFALNVGVAVPGRYHYYPLPEDIVSFVPEYRGYDYFIADEQIVIIDPATHEIVDVIPEG